MKRILYTITALLGFYHYAHSQITYHDVNPDTTVNAWNSFTIAPFGGAHTASGNYIDIWWHPTPEVVVTSWNDFQIMCTGTGTTPAKLNTGDSITSAASWKNVTYDPLSSNGTGNWTSNATDKYLGFRIKNAGLWNYGWIKLSVANGATSFTIKEWAFNASGNKINAGQKTTTSIAIVNTKTLQLYPNPAQNIINIQLSKTTIYDVRILGINGAIIKTITMKGNEDIDIRDIPKGVYNISAHTSNDHYSGVFIKQ